MKKCLYILLCLCLLLTACGGGGDTSEPLKPTVAPDPFTPFYSDYGVRSMRVRVVSGTDELDRMGDLNNLYDNQALSLYQTLNTAAYRESYLSAPVGTPWVRLTFRPHSELNAAGETYTVYENDLVVVEHPTKREQAYTAASGTYYQTVTRLNALREEQSRYITLHPYDVDEHTAGYTIHYQNGKSEFYGTGTDLPYVDMVGEGILRVEFRQTYTFYDTKTGKNNYVSGRSTDVAGDTVAVAVRDGVELYPLFSRAESARVYAEADSVCGLSFSEDGTSLHVVCARGDTDAVWDRTLAVTDLLGGTRYYLSAWQTAPDATEKEQQTVGYSLLSKIRHKEKTVGHTLSALPQKRLELDGTVYFLTEIGYWEKVENKMEYTAVAHLMVDEKLTVAYEATPSDNELTWDVHNNWMKR